MNVSTKTKSEYKLQGSLQLVFLDFPLMCNMAKTHQAEYIHIVSNRSSICDFVVG